jgi:hypothetical protein
MIKVEHRIESGKDVVMFDGYELAPSNRVVIVRRKDGQFFAGAEDGGRWSKDIEAGLSLKFQDGLQLLRRMKKTSEPDAQLDIERRPTIFARTKWGAEFEYRISNRGPHIVTRDSRGEVRKVCFLKETGSYFFGKNWMRHSPQFYAKDDGIVTLLSQYQVPPWTLRRVSAEAAFRYQLSDGSGQGIDGVKIRSVETDADQTVSKPQSVDGIIKDQMDPGSGTYLINTVETRYGQAVERFVTDVIVRSTVNLSKLEEAVAKLMPKRRQHAQPATAMASAFAEALEVAVPDQPVEN